MIRKNLLVLSFVFVFVFVFVLGGAFMFAYKNADAVIGITDFPVGVNYSKIATWTPSVGLGVIYDIEVFNVMDVTKTPVFALKGLTKSSYDLTNIAGNTLYYRVRANNAYGASPWSNLFLVKPILATEVAKATSLTTTPVNVGYDFISTDTKLKAFLNAYNIYKTIPVLVTDAKAKDKVYKTAYNLALSSIRALQTKNTIANKTLANAKLLDFQKKLTTLQNSIKTLNIKLKSLDDAVALMTKTEESSNGEITIGNDTVTINAKAYQAVFTPVVSKYLKSLNLVGSVSGGTVKINGDNVTIDSNIINDPVVESWWTYCITGGNSAHTATAGDVARCATYAAAMAH